MQLQKNPETFMFDESCEIVRKQLDQSQHGFRRHRSVVTKLFLSLDLLSNETLKRQTNYTLIQKSF